MPQVRLGNTVVANQKLGSTQLQKAYIGTTLVWQVALDWIGSAATLSLTARSSTWGPALVPSGRTVHWDAAHEASFTYVSDTNLVQQWEDLSGNGWWIKEAGAALNQYPTREIGYNGIPVIHFEADQWLVHWIDSSTPAEINLAQPITLHLVAAALPYAGSGYPVGLIGGTGSGAEGIQVTVQDNMTLLFAGSNFVNYPGYDRDQHIITAVFNGSSSVQRIDGVQIGTGDVGTGGIKRLQIGITHQLLEAVVCEYVFYNRVLTGPEIAYNEDLLRAKWFKPAGVWTGSPATVTIEGTARTWFTGAAPAFQPDRIENCFAWWDASDATTFTFSSGISVSQWRDKTSAGRHLAAVNSSVEPDRTGTINGLGVVSYDGTQWQFIGPSEPGAAPPSQPTAIFVVASMQTHTDWTNLIAGTTGGAIYRSPSSSNVGFSAGIGAQYAVDTSPHLFGVVFDRAKSQQRIDGLRVGTANTGPQNMGPLRVGTGAFAGHGLRGQIAEICMYTRNLNSTEITEIETYLTAKWFGPPGPQTWTGSAATVTYTATSGTWGVASLPDAPTLNSASAGNTTVTLTWTAPVITGGTITGYLVEKSPNGTSSWSTVTTTGAVLTYTVTGLTNGTIQYFRVSAINATGTGAASNVMSATPSAGGVVYSDDFNRADTTTVAASGAGLGASWGGHGVFYISSNTAHWTGDDKGARWTTALPSSDHWAEIDVVAAGGADYPIVHARCPSSAAGDAGTWYGVFGHPDDYVVIGKTVAGSYSNVATGGSYSYPCKLRIEVEGTAIRGYINGVLQVSGTDSSITSGLYTGFGGYEGASTDTTRFDNFRCGALPYTAP